MAKIAVTVESSPAGPTSFTLGSRSFKVAEILDGWHGDDYTYHKVLADDGNMYLLKETSDGWELIMMESPRTERAQTPMPAGKEAGG